MKRRRVMDFDRPGPIPVVPRSWRGGGPILVALAPYAEGVRRTGSVPVWKLSRFAPPLQLPPLCTSGDRHTSAEAEAGADGWDHCLRAEPAGACGVPDCARATASGEPIPHPRSSSTGSWCLGPGFGRGFAAPYSEGPPRVAPRCRATSSGSHASTTRVLGPMVYWNTPPRVSLNASRASATATSMTPTRSLDA